MNRTFKRLVVVLGAGMALGGGVALAQVPSPAQPPPMQAPPIPPNAPMPGNHPPMPGARPPSRPGMPPGRLPPGFNPHGGPRRPSALPRPAVVEEEEHGGGAHHECPGHGAEDPPPPPNWWHGILMVNNQAAEKGGFVNQLLFRYENPKDPCDPKNEPAPFLASAFNVGLLAFILYRFGRKPMAEALVKRKQTIMADIETATRLKEDAEGRLADYQEKIDNIEAKLGEVRSELAVQAESEKKHVLAEAEERRARMRKDAELRVEQELKMARAELLREATVKAIAAAEEMLAKQMSAGDLDRMASDYLKSVGPSLSGVRS